jgi:hypothetical protein
LTWKIWLPNWATRWSPSPPRTTPWPKPSGIPAWSCDINLGEGGSGIDAVSEIWRPSIFGDLHHRISRKALDQRASEPTYLIAKPFLRKPLQATVGQRFFHQPPGNGSISCALSYLMGNGVFTDGAKKKTPNGNLTPGWPHCAPILKRCRTTLESLYGDVEMASGVPRSPCVRREIADRAVAAEGRPGREVTALEYKEDAQAGQMKTRRGIARPCAGAAIQSLLIAGGLGVFLGAIFLPLGIAIFLNPLPLAIRPKPKSFPC